MSKVADYLHSGTWPHKGEQVALDRLPPSVLVSAIKQMQNRRKFHRNVNIIMQCGAKQIELIRAADRLGVAIKPELRK